MTFITDWVKDIFVLIVTISFMEILLPPGNLTKYVKYIFSLCILGIIILPLVKFIA